MWDKIDRYNDRESKRKKQGEKERERQTDRMSTGDIKEICPQITLLSVLARCVELCK